MATVLQNVLSVTGLAAGAQTTIAHGINVDSLATAPNKVIADRSTPIRVLTVTATDVTFENAATSGDPVSASFLCQLDHSIQQATPTGAPIGFYAQGGGGGQGVPQEEEANGWYPPASPNAANDEFETGTVLDSAWVLDDGSSAIAAAGTAFDSYSAYTVGNPRLDVNSRRASWLLIQPASDGAAYNITKSLVPAGDFLAIIRVRVGTMSSTGSGNMSLVAGSDGGGFLDPSNRLQVQVNQDFLRFTRVIGGVSTTITTTATMGRTGTMFTYCALQRVGTDVYAWIGTGAGNWFYLGTSATSPTLERFGFRFNGGSSQPPGPATFGADFFRYYPGASTLVVL